MYRLRAVVKSFKADPVCQALLKAGVDEVYVEEVQGYGRQKGHLGLYRQPAFGIAFLPKIAITAYLPDSLVEPACRAIEEVAVTGTIGDGKIFITPIDYAIPHALETGLAAAPAVSARPARKKRAAKAGRTPKPVTPAKPTNSSRGRKLKTSGNKPAKKRTSPPTGTRGAAGQAGRKPRRG